MDDRPEKNPNLPPRRLYPDGELDERYYEYVRPYDIFRPGSLDMEDPSMRLSVISSEATDWARWQEDTPFVDEDGKTHKWEKNKSHYYASKDELGRPVRLRAEFVQSEGFMPHQRLFIRELRDNGGVELEDCGETMTDIWGRGRFAQWREPGVKREEKPTVSITSANAIAAIVRKCERAYTLLANGKLIGYESSTGGFVPAHRVPRPK